MGAKAPTGTKLRVAALNGTAPTAFDIRPDAPERTALAEELGLLGLRKLRLAGEIRPEGRRGWRLEAQLGATVVQPCTVTLAPVTTRIEEEVLRIYRPDAALPHPDAGSETEMHDEDAETEPLPETLDLWALLSEELALALPPYPRSPEADSALPEADPEAEDSHAEARPNPFAALSALKDRLGDGETSDD